MDPATLDGWVLFTKAVVWLLFVTGVDLGIAFLARALGETEKVLDD